MCACAFNALSFSYSLLLKPNINTNLPCYRSHIPSKLFFSHHLATAICVQFCCCSIYASEKKAIRIPFYMLICGFWNNISHYMSEKVFFSSVAILYFLFVPRNVQLLLAIVEYLYFLNGQPFCADVGLGTISINS